MKWFSLLPVVLLMLAMLLFASPIAYADDPPDEDPDMEVDIDIDGELEVDIGVSGPAELNVGVEGPSEVHIDAGDEVELNVQASDESQVFIDDEKLDESLKLDDQSLDNPAQTDDPSATYQESGDIDEHSSRLDNLAIISGAFLAVGLPCFFLIRRKAKVNNEEVRK